MDGVSSVHQTALRMRTPSANPPRGLRGFDELLKWVGMKIKSTRLRINVHSLVNSTSVGFSMFSLIPSCVRACVCVRRLQLGLLEEVGVPTAGGESCPNLLTLSVVEEKHKLGIPALTTPERIRHFS